MKQVLVADLLKAFKICYTEIKNMHLPLSDRFDLPTNYHRQVTAPWHSGHAPDPKDLGPEIDLPAVLPFMF